MITSLRSRSILLTGLLLASPAVASAQTTLELSGGAVWASVEGDDAPEPSDSRASFNVGAQLGVPLTDLLSLHPGVFYVEKGNSVGDFDLKLNYVEVPILLRVALAERSAFGVSVFAGPSFAVEVQCYQEEAFTEDDGLEIGNVECDDLDEPVETKSFDVGAVFGGGLSAPVSDRMTVTLSGGVDLGLTTIDDSAADLDRRNSAYFLNVGVGWLLGG